MRAERNDEADGALSRLQGLLADRQYPLNGRLPPERSLCRELGVNRGALRKALAVLEAEGQIWRHVGRGTFVGTRPAETVGELRASAAAPTRPR
jgi:DNA-binding GntR family transcriptional regulator